MLRIRRAAWIAAACLLGTGPALGGEETQDLGRWAEGPVRYIARPEEMKEFRALATDSERALFIERFWERRDPSETTLANEYRQIFWERVRDANELYVDSPGPGWRTDRGKIHVLYGPPNSIESDLALETDDSPGRGVIRWIYSGRPGGRTDLNPNVVVPFVRDAGGEWRVSYDPTLASIFWDPHAIRERNLGSFEQLRASLAQPRQSELAVMLDLGRMQEVPPQELVLIERVETFESYATVELEGRMSRYDAEDASGVLTVLTLDVSYLAEPTRPAVMARFEPREPGATTRVLGEDSFRFESSAGVRLVQGRLVLAPGTYDVMVLVVDPEAAATGVFRAEVSVPARATDLRISDVTWAARLEPVEFAALASHREPFQVGPFRVLPKVDDQFRRGDRVTMFYEVYGGSPPYTIRYQLEGREEDGSWSALGRPAEGQQTGQAQGWELATSAAWPVGEYRIRVEVGDSGQGRVGHVVPFTLADSSER